MTFPTTKIFGSLKHNAVDIWTKNVKRATNSCLNKANFLVARKITVDSFYLFNYSARMLNISGFLFLKKLHC